MVDVVDFATRSRMMSGIRGKDTKPERDLRAALEGRGFFVETHDKELPGRPDIVLPQHRAVILVHGCFWHRHPDCRFSTTPSTRPEFWRAKFESNVSRDARNLAALHAAGWRTAIVWECALRRVGTAREVADELADWLASVEQTLEVGSPS